MNTEPAARPGIKTTEFWTLLVVNLITVALAYFEKVEGTTAAIIVAVLSGLYATLRSSLKNNLIKSVPLLILALFAGFMIPSCNWAESGIRGQLYYQHPDTGAKGGLTLADGQPTGFFKIPIRDADGNITGYAEVARDLPVLADK